VSCGAKCGVVCITAECCESCAVSRGRWLLSGPAEGESGRCAGPVLLLVEVVLCECRMGLRRGLVCGGLCLSTAHAQAYVWRMRFS
jgi:hypothetical protein